MAKVDYKVKNQDWRILKLPWDPFSHRHATNSWGTPTGIDTQAGAAEEVLGAGDVAAEECPLLGKQVVITGTSREDLNGKAGVATSFDHARGRYAVVLDQPGSKGPVALRPHHLHRPR